LIIVKNSNLLFIVTPSGKAHLRRNTMAFNLKHLFAIAGVAAAIALTGCSEQETPVDNTKVKIGVMAGAEEQVAEVAAKQAKDKYGLDVEIG
jgi:D-methionine transport system substrate-binding protein